MASVSTTAIQRLRRDAARIAKDPVPFVIAAPLPSNILEWHYVVQGPPDSPYEGGFYHGKLIFPFEYPFKPPSIYMLTPNGRFKTNTRLCLSISDFHPDTWNPAWSVSTILTGLLSFMLENTATFGSLEMSDYEKRALARASLAYNMKSKTFRDLFPDLCKQSEQDTRKESESCARRTTGASSAAAAGPAAELERETGDSEDDDHRWRGRAGSAISNLLMFAGVVAFVFIAKYVLQSTE